MTALIHARARMMTPDTTSFSTTKVTNDNTSNTKINASVKL